MSDKYKQDRLDEIKQEFGDAHVKEVTTDKDEYNLYLEFADVTFDIKTSERWGTDIFIVHTVDGRDNHSNEIERNLTKSEVVTYIQNIVE